jgi:stage II sporulation protein D
MFQLPSTSILSFTPVSAMSAEPNIKIGLWTNQSSILISADIDFDLVNSNTMQTVDSFKANEKAAVSINNTGILINNKLVDANKLSVILKTEENGHFIEVNKRWYRGSIEIYSTKQKERLTVVNTLPLEQYLYGVIAKEISPDWNIEAVKAQVVAARTYALANLGRHRENGYDLCASSDCQVYGGKDSESNRVISAVDDTCGLILTYQGKPIQAYFHSSSGGYTENSENVWGTYLPYIRAVADDDQKSPYFKWEKKLTAQEINAIIARAGYNIGSLQAIELSVLKNQPMSLSDRGVSGRVKSLRLIGKSGSIQISGEKFRNMLTLNSTLFDIKVVSSVQKTIEFEIVDTAGQQETKTIEVNLPPAEGKISVIDKANLRRIMGSNNEEIVISGAGWGHGLGLSQWGAKAMADKAAKGNTEYFKEILKHYYHDVEIIKKY